MRATPLLGCEVPDDPAPHALRATLDAAHSLTKIDTDAGERWFCDEAEAMGAGWRPARAR